MAKYLALLVLVLGLVGIVALGVVQPTRQAGQGAGPPLSLGLQEVASGLDEPVAVVDPQDGSPRLYIVLQEGRIVVDDDGKLLPAPFLDIRALVHRDETSGGLLGLAFHPDFAQNGLFYVAYADTTGNLVVARYHSGDATTADPGSGISLLTIDNPTARHYGGALEFGPDGYLYLGVGDGDRDDDPTGAAQDPAQLLGKLLRIDVDHGEAYAIPTTNPLATAPGVRREIWDIGLRNPWGLSFDRQTGDLWLADVGQDQQEEINLELAETGGWNYGWPQMEGRLCLPLNSECNDLLRITPVASYGHQAGDCAVIGGYRYRGALIPPLYGTYVFGDYCSGRVWGLTEGREGGWLKDQLLDTDLNIAAFGEDERGELLLADYGGAVYRVTP